MDKLRILIAHDKQAIAQAIARILEAYGFAVTPLTDGDAVVAALEGGRWDGLVVDAGILGTPIHELCERAKAGESVVPAVIMIAAIFRRQSYRRRPKNLYGADDVVEVHRVAAELPAKLWGLFSGKDADAAAKAEAEMALWSLRGEGGGGSGRLISLVAAGLVLERADEVANTDEHGELVALFAEDLADLEGHLAGVLGEPGLRPALDAAFQGILGHAGGHAGGDSGEERAGGAQ